MGGLFRISRRTVSTVPVWTSATTLSIAHGQTINLNTLCTSSLGISYTSTTLPSGLSLVSPNLICANNAPLGTFSVTFIATNTSNETASKTFAVTIIPVSISLAIPTISLVQGNSTNVVPYVTGGIYPYSFAVTAQATQFAAAGLTLTTAGVITAAINATVQTTGNYQITVTDSQPQQAQSAIFSVTVLSVPATITVNIPSLLEFRFGVPKSYVLSGPSYITGNATRYVLNKDPSVDGQLTGITFNAGNATLSYDGTGTIPQSGYDFILAASDGEIPVIEDKISYKGLKPTSSLTSGMAGYWDQGDGPYKRYGNFNIKGPLTFNNQKGDWWGADGQPQGTAFGTFSVTGTGLPKSVSVDVTAIVQAWQAGTYPNLGFMLQQGTGQFNFNSSRVDAGVTGPKLALTFVDGSTPVTLNPTADNMLLFSSTGFWTNPILQSASPNILFFDSDTWKPVATATLSLTAVATFGGTPTANVYATRWQSQDSAIAPTLGIGVNYPNGVGLATDTNVLVYEDYGTTGTTPSGTAWQCLTAPFNFTSNQADLNALSNYLVHKNPWYTFGHVWDMSSYKQGTKYSDWNLRNPDGQAPWSPNRIVGDTDPMVPNYAPLKPGIKAFSATVFQGEDGSGMRHIIPFYPIVGAINGTTTDPQELYAGFWVRLGDNWNPAPESGHQSGFRSEYPNPFASRETSVFKFVNLPFNGKPIDNPAYITSGVTNNNYAFSWFYAQMNYSCVSTEYATTNPLEVSGFRTVDLYNGYWTNVPPDGIPNTSDPHYNVPWNQLNRTDLNTMVSLGGNANYLIPKTGFTLPQTLGSRGILRKNRWYWIEQHVKINSLRASADGSGSIGNSDGILEMWVDGRLAFQDLNHVFRNDGDSTTQAGAGIQMLAMEQYHGGQLIANSTFTQYWTGVTVSTRYIGPPKLV